MTMPKGKKQQSDHTDCDIPLRSSTLMSDDEYAHGGSLLGRIQGGREAVLVEPLRDSRGRPGIVQTPLGRLPRSLMTTFGLEDPLIDLFLREAQPRCSHCGVLAEGSEPLDLSRWPEHGYVAVVVHGVEESVPLEERCELLEVERAVIDGVLVRKDDIAGREGEPVLTIAPASDGAHISREVERWLSRGGGALRLMHYPSRTERGVEMRKIFKEWRCPSCGDSYPLATRQRIEDAPPCQRCRGEGWLLVEDDRFVACDDCDAFGRTSPLARYEVAGTLVKDLAQLPFGAVKDLLSRTQEGRSHEVAERFSALCDEGFSHYSLGMPVDLLSKGERVLATIASARLSAIADVELVVDAGGLGAPTSWIESLVKRDKPPRVRVSSPPVPPVEGSVWARAGQRVFTLRDIVVGPLSVPTLSFDVGALTVVQGEPGVGKTLLLDEIARRFSKRKKLAHLGSFGDMKRCHRIGADSRRGETVMDLLGISELIAEQAVRTRHARERGLSKEDFLPSRSRHRCDLCKGSPSHDDAKCAMCDGGLFDHLVGGVVVNNLPFADLVRSSLAQAGEVLWADDELAGVLARVPDDLKRSLALGACADSLAPAVRRFLSAFGGLASALTRKGGLASDLVLVDVPFGTTSSYQRILIQCINELRSRGATIVCAGVPEALENIFSSVIRLRFVEKPQRDMRAHRFLDIRMTRKSEVFIER